MSAALQAVFFDVGNTLLFPNRQRILQPLHARRGATTLEQLHAIERKTKKEFDRIHQQTGGRDHGFWHIFYTLLLEELHLEDETLRDTLVAATRISANWDNVLPGTRDVLQQIGKRFRTGVISNADGRIAEVLGACGIADCFLTITDSGRVGHEKPHPAIFQAALRELGARPEQSLFVGDVYCVDYLGATRAGMQATLFDVAGAYRDSGLPRVESLQELQERLEGDDRGQ